MVYVHHHGLPLLVVAGGLAVMGLTLPFRKGVAIAFDYLIDQITEET